MLYNYCSNHGDNLIMLTICLPEACLTSMPSSSTMTSFTLTSAACAGRPAYTHPIKNIITVIATTKLYLP